MKAEVKNIVRAIQAANCAEAISEGMFDEAEREFQELERLAEIGRLTEKLLETGSMQHRFKYLDDIRSVEQLIEWGKDK